MVCAVQGRNGAVSVIALAERGALFDPGPCMYMEKLAGALARPCARRSLSEVFGDQGLM